MRIIITILLFNFFIQSYAQKQIRYFEIKTNLFKLGDLKVSKTENRDNDSVRYRLTTKLHVFSLYKVDYLMESVYCNDIMTYSKSCILINGDTNHWVENIRKDSVYYVKSFDRKDSIMYSPITNSITPLYFRNYNGADSIYSEYSGDYKPFVRKDDSTIVLDPENPMYFILPKDNISKVVIPNSIMDFFIVETDNISE